MTQVTAEASIDLVRKEATDGVAQELGMLLRRARAMSEALAREVRAGRLRAGNSPRGRWAFAIDSVVTVLGAPLVLLLSAPSELVAALVRRGGELTASARRDGVNGG